MLWVEMLNRALEWNAPRGAALPLHPQGGTRLEPSVRAALGRDVLLLRRIFAARAAGAALEPGDTARLSQWLATITLQPAPLATDALPLAPEGLAWPEFVARRRTGGTCEPFESLLSTALMQLLGLPGTWLGQVVHRCQGLRRGPAPEDGWPGEAGEHVAAVLEDGVDGVRLHQCPRLVWSPRGSRFCSKACSNASFAVRKARREPRYFAAKQDRYRTRRKRQQRPRARAGAFVYMD